MPWKGGSVKHSADGRFDPTDAKTWARAFARHVYATGGPLRDAPKHAQRAAKPAKGDEPEQKAIKTWGDVGRRMFPDDFDRELAWWYDESGMTSDQAKYTPVAGSHQVMLVESVCEFLDIGDEHTIFEICQMLKVQSGDSFWTDVGLHAIDLHYTLAIFPTQFQLAEPRHCSVTGVMVKSVWRRIA
jgi:hypothetical protein